MPDQAAGLRSLFARRRPALLVVAGGDPGKAAVAVHFARESAAAGRATVLIDGTPGQAAAACNVSCRYELAHVLAGDLELDAVLLPLTPDLLLLPAARALSRLGSLSNAEEARLQQAFSVGLGRALRRGDGGDGPEPQIDLIVVNADVAKGGRALDVFGRDARVVIVASQYAASLRAAYREIKALSQEQGVESFEIVVPVPDGDAASDVGATNVAFTNIANAARRFLEVAITDGGTVVVEPPKDLRVNGRPIPARSSGPHTPSGERTTGPFAAPASARTASPHHHPFSSEVSHAAVA